MIEQPQNQPHQTDPLPHPGIESEMAERPRFLNNAYRGSGKLEGKVALITGGDSGIGRSIAIHFAKEGADVAISYLNEDSDAEETARFVEAEGRRCLLLPGDIGVEAHCNYLVDKTVRELGHLNILVNNAGVQYPKYNIEEISAEQLEHTFRVNLFAQFFLIKAALPHMGEGDSIINTTSITAYRGAEMLIDYSASKGAIVTFTRSLSQSLVKRGIRVNGVAPGPIWTPLITSSFGVAHKSRHGAGVPMGRSGQPDEVAPSFVFLASADSSYMTGQILHPNGGIIVNG
jgi:NAD(P)-dependent dehydrogenase (short-subunit alcohol dehydrogenase family)